MSLVIAITGGSASGKTSIVKKLKEKLANDICFLGLDYYYKTNLNIPLEQRSQFNYDIPDAFDFDKFYEDSILLKSGKDIYVNEYDYENYKSSNEIINIISKKIIILEGIFTLNDNRIRSLADVKIFVDTDSDTRLARRIDRDTKENNRKTKDIIFNYLNVIKPSYEKYIEPTKKYADIIIPRGVENNIAIDILIKYLEKKLEEMDV